MPHSFEENIDGRAAQAAAKTLQQTDEFWAYLEPGNRVAPGADSRIEALVRIYEERVAAHLAENERESIAQITREISGG